MGTRFRAVSAWTGLLLALAGCAGRNEFVHSANYQGRIAGFWAGLWHGLTAPVSLIGSAVLDINIYEVYNKGFLYNSGFVLGFAALAIGMRRIPAWLAARRRRLAAEPTGSSESSEAASEPS